MVVLVLDEMLLWEVAVEREVYFQALVLRLIQTQYTQSQSGLVAQLPLIYWLVVAVQILYLVVLQLLPLVVVAVVLQTLLVLVVALVVAVRLEVVLVVLEHQDKVTMEELPLLLVAVEVVHLP